MDRGYVFDRPVAMMRRRRYALLVTVFALQTLLWASVFVAASTVFLFVGGDIDASVLVPEILLLASAGSSLCYIVLYATTSRLRNHPLSGWTHRAVPMLRWLCNALILLVVVAWLASCGVLTTVTVARQAFCLATTEGSEELWMSGKTCILQRSSLAAGLLCLVSSAILSVALVLSHDPFAAGLFGYSQPARYTTLPAISHPMTPTYSYTISARSSKRRSSSSLSTLIASPTYYSEKNSWGKKPMGLGISASPTSPTSPKKHCFLSARPSLAAIRESSGISAPQAASSPLPPLPVYFAPHRPSMVFRDTSIDAELRRPRVVMHSRTHTQIHPSHPARKPHVSPPLPSPVALTAANLAASRSHVSLKSTTSSLYSRSVSGEGKQLPDGETKAFTRSPLGGAVSFVDQDDGDPRDQDMLQAVGSGPRVHPAYSQKCLSGPEAHVKPLVIRKTRSLDV